MKVCHLTTLHSSTDTRIFIKECVTLARAGHDVSLICMDGSASRTEKGVRIISLPRLESGGRIAKMRRAPELVLTEALELGADVYHFHDPELLSVGSKLKKRGKIVIYDSHEDVPQQILTKPWIPSYLRKLVSFMYSVVEERAVRKFDCIVTVNEPIAERFRALEVPVVILYNYPLLDDIGYADTYLDRSPLVCYVGNITKLRGVDRLAEVTKLAGVPLALAGPVDAGDFADLDWLSSPNVTYSGILDRQGVSNLYERATVGMVTFLPAPNHFDALPNKLFEYMVAGLPLIVSDFPKWRSMVEDIHCGLVVDPQDTGDIVRAVEYLHGHPEEAREMGLRGRQAVLSRYNWQSEGEKLIELYARFSVDLDLTRSR